MNIPVAFSTFTVLCRYCVCLGPHYFHHSTVKPLPHLAVFPHSALPPCVVTPSLCSVSMDPLFWVFLRQCFFCLAYCFFEVFWSQLLDDPPQWVLSPDRQSYCTFLWMPLVTHLSTNDFSFWKDKNIFCPARSFSHQWIPISGFPYYICPHRLCMFPSYPMDDLSFFISLIISSTCLGSYLLMAFYLPSLSPLCWAILSSIHFGACSSGLCMVPDVSFSRA